MTDEKSYNQPLYTFILAAIGAALSVLGLFEHSKIQYGTKFGIKLPQSFCNIGASFNCDAVNQSAWSYLFGVPVASWGVWFYLTLLAICLIAKGASSTKRSDMNGMFLVISIFAALFSLYLFVVSEVFIKSLCLICVGLYTVNLLLLLLSIFSNPDRVPFMNRIALGIRAIVSAPRLLTKPNSALPYVSVLYSGLAFVMSLTLSQFLFLEVALPQAGRYGVEAQVTKWEQEKKDDIDLTLDDSVMRDYFKGDLRAPITIVEFADFECPACQRFYLELSDVLEKYKKNILFIYRNYPLSNICNSSMPAVGHPNACFAAHLSRCAGEQGAYWEMADYLFTLGTDPALKGAKPDRVHEVMEKGIDTLGLDRSEIESCISSNRHSAKIQKDIAEGNRLGLRATPSLWINGKQVQQPSFEIVEGIIKRLLSENH